MCLRAAEEKKMGDVLRKNSKRGVYLTCTCWYWDSVTDLLESVMLSSFHLHFLSVTSAQTTLWLGTRAENFPPIRASCLDYCIFFTHQLSGHRCFHLQWLDFGRTWEVLFSFLCTATCSEDVFLDYFLMYAVIPRTLLCLMLVFVVGRWGLT